MGELIWDERLISYAEACALAGTWPLRAAIRQHIWFADCGKCGQAMLVLGQAGNAFPLTGEQVIAAVLRHMVMAHDVPLNQRRDPNGRGPGRGAGEGAAAGVRGGRGGGAGADPARGRQPDQEPGDPRKPETAGGGP